MGYFHPRMGWRFGPPPSGFWWLFNRRQTVCFEIFLVCLPAICHIKTQGLDWKLENQPRPWEQKYIINSNYVQEGYPDFLDFHLVGLSHVNTISYYLLVCQLLFAFLIDVKRSALNLFCNTIVIINIVFKLDFPV